MLAKYYTHLPLTPLREFPLLSANAASGVSGQIVFLQFLPGEWILHLYRWP
jgi:hypothetical protein